MNEIVKNNQAAYRMPSLDRFSMAVDEIRLTKNLEKLTSLAERYGSLQAPRDLMDEIAAQQQSLKKLREDRSR